VEFGEACKHLEKFDADRAAEETAQLVAKLKEDRGAQKALPRVPVAKDPKNLRGKQDPAQRKSQRQQ